MDWRVHAGDAQAVVRSSVGTIVTLIGAPQPHQVLGLTPAACVSTRGPVHIHSLRCMDSA